jgi:hypothetical protein
MLTGRIQPGPEPYLWFCKEDLDELVQYRGTSWGTEYLAKYSHFELVRDDSRASKSSH